MYRIVCDYPHYNTTNIEWLCLDMVAVERRLAKELKASAANIDIQFLTHDGWALVSHHVEEERA